MFTTIIPVIALLIGFLIAWIIKSKQSPADTILITEKNRQLETDNNSLVNTLEKLRQSVNDSMSQAATFKALLEQETIDKKLVKDENATLQVKLNDINKLMAAATVKLQTAEQATVVALEDKSGVIADLTASKIANQQIQEQLIHAKEELNGANLQLKHLQERLSEGQSIQQKRDAELVAVSEHYKIAQNNNYTLKEDLRVAKIELDTAKDDLKKQEARMLELNKTQLLEFEKMANKILDDKTQKFAESNQEKVNLVLKPLQTKIEEFQKQVTDVYQKESKERFTLENSVKELVKQSQSIGMQADNLATAFKNNHKQQGNWGEMILESILENSGLIKGQQFKVQEFIRDASGNTIKGEDGKALQPDVTVYYPDDRKIIIDSKVSLLAYESYINAASQEEGELSLKEHGKAIKNHVDSLSRKNYAKYAKALDYVLMFVPVEPAFLEALKSDTQLWKYAYDKGIVLVSPTNLLAILKIVEEMWKVDKQTQNAKRIADQAGGIYEKFVGFLNTFKSVGDSIEKAHSSYTEAHKQLSIGRDNFSRKVEVLKKLGANIGNNNKGIPEDFLKEE